MPLDTGSSWREGMSRYELIEEKGWATSRIVPAFQATTAYAEYMRETHSRVMLPDRKRYKRAIWKGEEDIEPPVIGPKIFLLKMNPEPLDIIETGGPLGTMPLSDFEGFPLVLSEYTYEQLVRLTQERLRVQIEELLELRELQRTLAHNNPNYRHLG